MLPNDLSQTDYQSYFKYCGISSDNSIYFKAQDLRKFYHIYRVDLNQENLVLEHCARLGG